MVKFLPFSGYRPVLDDGEKISERISPPYDVISEEYLKTLQSCPFNVTRITLMPKDGQYKESAHELRAWQREGKLKAETVPSFYLYQQTFNNGLESLTRTGIVGIMKTEDYEAGNIIPHEETYSNVKEDRLNLLRDISTHSESIFGIFEGFDDGITSRISSSARPLYEHLDREGVLHRFLLIDDEALLEDIEKSFSNQKMLIADGHHRFETALAYSKENPDDEKKSYVLTTMVSARDPGLVIWPTHRLVKVDGYHETSLISELGENFKMEAVALEDLPTLLPEHDMALLLRSGKAFLLSYEDHDDPLWSLDTYIAQEAILKGMLGYKEGRAKVSYDAEMGSTLKKMARGGYDLAVLFNPPSFEKVWELSLAGKRMPKKSTYFFPKIWSGFVYYQM